MSSHTWTRTPTTLVLALAIVTAATCIKISNAQDMFQGFEAMAETIAEIWPEFRPEIEDHAKAFKDGTLENIRALMNMVICNKAVQCGKKASRQLAIGLVPHRRQDNSESILIMENSGKETDISHWTNALNEKIEAYKGGRTSTHTLNYVDCNENSPAIPEVNACIFDYQWLGSDCTEEENWGYGRKSPCIIVEMNKIVNWVPDVYKSIEELPTDMPENLKTNIKQRTDDNLGSVPQMLWLNCKGLTSDDDEHIGEVVYTPWQGFPAYYFPYIGNDEWLAPMVAVRFVAPARDVLINIECRVYSKDITHLRNDSYLSVVGVMNFELLIDFD